MTCRREGAFHLFLLNKVLYNMGESYASPKVLAPVYLQELLIHGLLVPKKKHPREAEGVGKGLLSAPGTL